MTLKGERPLEWSVHPCRNESGMSGGEKRAHLTHLQTENVEAGLNSDPGDLIHEE